MQQAREVFKTIRLDSRRLGAILDRLDGLADQAQHKHQQERQHPRYAMRIHACVIHMQQPGENEPTAYLAPTRDISAMGMSFLHGGYVHPQTKCAIHLISSHGTWSDVDGTVVRCRYVDGPIHEVAVQFSHRIEPSEFCPTAFRTRVLLAEDDPALVQLTLVHLNVLNAEADHAENGRLAVDRALAKPYDIILMDIEMPVLDGLAAVTELRAAGYSGRIIAMTSLSQPADRERCLAAGFDGYLAKPFSRSELAREIEAVREKPLLSTLESDPELLPVIQQFVADLPARLQRVQEAFDRRSNLELEAAARIIKGPAGGFGFQPISDAAATLEQAARERQPHVTLKRRVDELAHWCGRARATVPEGGSAVVSDSVLPSADSSHQPKDQKNGTLMLH